METNETKADEKATKENAKEDSNNGNKSEATDLIGRADQARERLETQHQALQSENERLERNLRELRELEARRVLGGQSFGNQQKEEKKETPKEFKDKVLREGKFPS